MLEAANALQALAKVERTEFQLVLIKFDLEGGLEVIPTAKIHDAFAHARLVRVAMVSGVAIRAFQASQQASTISS